VAAMGLSIINSGSQVPQRRPASGNWGKRGCRCRTKYEKNDLGKKLRGNSWWIRTFYRAECANRIPMARKEQLETVVRGGLRSRRTKLKTSADLPTPAKAARCRRGVADCGIKRVLESEPALLRHAARVAWFGWLRRQSSQWPWERGVCGIGSGVGCFRVIGATRCRCLPTHLVRGEMPLRWTPRFDLTSGRPPRRRPIAW